MSAHSLIRLTERLYGVPHLITESGLVPILEYLSNRNNGIYLNTKITDKSNVNKPAQRVGKIGEIAIDGALTYKPVEALCGDAGVSYQSILADAEKLINDGVTTLILTHSSPGGEASHCFSTANDLRTMCNENGVNLISYIDVMSASASLAIGVVADEVIIHPSATTGSIGCVVALLDRSKAMSNAGIKPIYISSTPGKTPFDPDGAFSTEFLERIQEDVSRLGLQFAEHVFEHTAIPINDILNMNAKMYHADAALEAGLVNKIMDHNQFTAYIAEFYKE